MIRRIKNTILTERKQLIKFLLVGISGVIVNMFFLWLFKDIIGLNIKIAGIIAIELSVINNFIFNNNWTFEHRKYHSTKIKFLRYHLSVLLGMALNYLILITLSEVFGIYYLIANFVGIGCATVSNYIFSSRWTWKY